MSCLEAWKDDFYGIDVASLCVADASEVEVVLKAE
jgi:hypothetical protein